MDDDLYGSLDLQKIPKYHTSNDLLIMRNPEFLSIQSIEKDDLDINDILQTSQDEYILNEIVGYGNFGVVYLAKSKNTGENVAVKKIKIYNELLVKNINREIENLQRVSKKSSCNKYILCYYDHKRINNFYYIVTEYINGITLYDYISNHPDLSTKIRLKIMFRLARALYVIHSNGIYHRDIKPQNILIRLDKLKLIDFGLSCYTKNFITDSDDCRVSGKIGTMKYISPEIIKWDSLNTINTKKISWDKVDIYAVGITFRYIMGDLKNFDRKIIFELKNLISLMTHKLPVLRPDSQKIVGDIKNIISKI